MTRAKETELLLVLDNPETPLHNVCSRDSGTRRGNKEKDQLWDEKRGWADLRGRICSRYWTRAGNRGSATYSYLRDIFSNKYSGARDCLNLLVGWCCRLKCASSPQVIEHVRFLDRFHERIINRRFPSTKKLFFSASQKLLSQQFSFGTL